MGILVAQTTKRALEASLKKLLLRKPLNKITINDITEDCGVNRMTFYYHFKDIYDLVDWILVEDATEALEGHQDYETWSDAFRDMLEKVQAMGVGIGYVTLHVGLGTFRPVKVDDVTQHHMHSEHYWVSQEAADLINEAKRTGHRVIAVGTTSCRTLESAYIPGKGLRECSDNTDIFIYPGYQWKCIDALITNFHLPESTLIMLVAAFAGYDHIMNAYHEAVKERYRFFSFGDAMFITNETKPQNTRH